jgi:hypothetical protein
MPRIGNARRELERMRKTRSVANISSSLVVVTGDVTMDWNIARTRRLDHGGLAWNADDVTRAYWQRGGAALLADVIEAVANELHESVHARYRVCQTAAPSKPVRPDDGRYHHSYAMWSLFEYEAGSSGRSPRHPKVWRVEEFMGLDRSPNEGSNDAREWKRVTDDPDEADIVILDDADLGFRKSPDFWPKAILSPNRSEWIIVKMARPVAQGDLWEHLQKNYADRLIVAMTVDDLRLSEVQISRGLSWERTAQDVVWELIHNPRVNGLSHCAHIIISFDTAGAILLSRSRVNGTNSSQPDAPVHRLFFDPKVIEGMWAAAYPGAMIGYTSCLTAGIAAQLMISLPEPDIGEGIQHGLASMRRLHCVGYGEAGTSAAEARLVFPFKPIATELTSQRSADKTGHIREFFEADIRDPMRLVTDQTTPGNQRVEPGFWTILGDRCTGSLVQAAQQTALCGAEVALREVPLGEFGGLLTVDRREIESFRSISSLVVEYVHSTRTKRPLNIAVFGAPGSGKSFGIAEVAKAVLPEQTKKLTFNLAQFTDPDQLHDALHQVRDAALSGLMPLVFWDEFDTSLNKQELGWLAHFLAPMQDGTFQRGQINHAIGRSIFVFAGGTKETMEEFDLGAADAPFRNAKGPDFVSRLRGYVNILGPNPRRGDESADPYFIIRRAILLRSILRRDAYHLFEEGALEKLNIDSGVLRGLLLTKEYKHGVRSMESLIAMSWLSGKRRFTRSALPAATQLDLHVDAVEFQALVQQIELEGELLERLAEAAHEVFCDGLRARGYRLGTQTNERQKTHRWLVPYPELATEEKEQNRGNVRDIPAKLARVGYVMIPARSNEPPFNFPGPDLESLAEMEHERWTKEKLKSGSRWGPRNDPKKKLHKDLLPWRRLTAKEIARRYTPVEAAAIVHGVLPEKEKEKDRDLVRGIPRILARAGFAIVPVGKQGSRSDVPTNGPRSKGRRNGRNRRDRAPDTDGTRQDQRGRARGATSG